jgi:hypothetical protein
VSIFWSPLPVKVAEKAELTSGGSQLGALDVFVLSVGGRRGSRVASAWGLGVW